MEPDAKPVAMAVAVFEEYVSHDDETMFYLFEDIGIEQSLCHRLIQFIPMVFTSYVFQSSGVTFATEYRTMARNGAIGGPIPLTENSVYRAVCVYCEAQSRDSWHIGSKALVAARSAGYKSIMQACKSGIRIEHVMTDQPILME